jgi:heme-degrading monooxygenase HmoA
MSVVFVNLFEVPEGRDEAFFALWEQVNSYMQRQPGYESHALHRALTPNATYRYVNIARWSSAESWEAAHDDGFRALVSQPGWQEFPPRPCLYEVVHSAQAAPAS